MFPGNLEALLGQVEWCAKQLTTIETAMQRLTAEIRSQILANSAHQGPGSINPDYPIAIDPELKEYFENHTQAQLRDTAAQICAKRSAIALPCRDEKRVKKTMLRWYLRHWHEIKDILPDLQLTGVDQHDATQPTAPESIFKDDWPVGSDFF
jgi:hypothetical protein